MLLNQDDTGGRLTVASGTGEERVSHNRLSAEQCAAVGLYVFPCRANKKPLPGLKWPEESTVDPKQIADWWTRYPDALPALDLAKSGYVVLDGDRHGGPDGVLALGQLFAENCTVVSAIPAVVTPQNGCHRYFMQPTEGEALGNGRGTLPKGIDVRGSGGYVIAPGTRLPDGRQYRPDLSSPDLFDAIKYSRVPVVPPWLVAILRSNGHGHVAADAAAPAASNVVPFRAERTTLQSTKREESYARAALDNVAGKIATATTGERNIGLNNGAFTMGQMVGAGWIGRATVEGRLLDAATASGLVRDDGRTAVLATIKSGLDAGEKQPHPSLPEEDRQPHIKSREELTSLPSDAIASWEDPDLSLLDDRRGQLPEFPIDELDPQWRSFIERAARGAGVTVAHVVVPLLTVVSGLLGAARRVQVTRSWIEVMSLWGAIIGYSGTGKTPGCDVTVRHLAHVQKDRRRDDDKRRLAHAKKVEVAKAAKAKYKLDVAAAMEAGKTPPDPPPESLDVPAFVPQRLYVSDATVEKLGLLLQARPSGLILFADELAGLFSNLSRYNGGSDREFWLQSWNGKPHSVERMGRPSIDIDHLLIGVVGGFQPDKLARSFKGDDDGLYARFCYTWPAEPPYRPLTDDAVEIDDWLINALNRVVELSMVDDDGVLASRTVPLATDARAAFEQFRELVHRERNALEGRERELWAKGQSQVLRLAGTLAYMAWALSGGPEPSRIDCRWIDAAVAIWRGYFWPHGRAALRRGGLTDHHADARRVLSWLRAKCKPDDEVSLEDIRRDALGQSLDAKGTAALVELLEGAGWLRRLPIGPTGRGRPRHRWQANPRLWGAQNAENAESPLTGAVRPFSAIPAISAVGERTGSLGDMQ
jgi:hypothetical protein